MADTTQDVRADALKQQLRGYLMEAGRNRNTNAVIPTDLGWQIMVHLRSSPPGGVGGWRGMDVLPPVPWGGCQRYVLAWRSKHNGKVWRREAFYLNHHALPVEDGDYPEDELNEDGEREFTCWCDHVETRGGDDWYQEIRIEDNPDCEYLGWTEMPTHPAAIAKAEAAPSTEREAGYLPSLTSDQHGDIYSTYGTHIAHAYGIDDAERQKLAKAIVERCNAYPALLRLPAMVPGEEELAEVACDTYHEFEGYWKTTQPMVLSGPELRGRWLPVARAILSRLNSQQSGGE